MDKKELMEFGNASVRKALSNMCVILDEDGNMLSRLDGDRMVFSPVLECDEKRSTILFDDEEKANGVIGEILFPQDGKQYSVFKFTSIDDGSDEDSMDGGFEIEYDSDDDGDEEYGEEELFGDVSDEESDEDDISIDDEIEFCKNIISDLESESGDSDDIKEYKDILSLLEELKWMKNEDSDDVETDDGDEESNGEDEDEESNGEDEDSSVKESVESPTFADAQRIFKRNGYELVSQKGYRQKWVNESIGDSFTLPYSSITKGHIDPSEWNSIVNGRNFELDV